MTEELFVTGVGGLHHCAHWPDHFCVILLAQNKSFSYLSKQLNNLGPELLKLRTPTNATLETVDVFAIFYEGQWLRVKADGPIFNLRANQYEVLCIDFGYKKLVISILISTKNCSVLINSLTFYTRYLSRFFSPGCFPLELNTFKTIQQWFRNSFWLTFLLKRSSSTKVKQQMLHIYLMHYLLTSCSFSSFHCRFCKDLLGNPHCQPFFKCCVPWACQGLWSGSALHAIWRACGQVLNGEKSCCAYRNIQNGNTKWSHGIPTPESRRPITDNVSFFIADL